MYKNEYLEKCLKEGKEINYYLSQGYANTKDHKYNELVIDSLSFIYDHSEQLQSFKIELINANIHEFVLTETSTALIKILHAFDKVGIKIKELAEVEYIDKWDKSEQIKQGIRMIIE